MVSPRQRQSHGRHSSHTCGEREKATEQVHTKKSHKKKASSQRIEREKRTRDTPTALLILKAELARRHTPTHAQARAPARSRIVPCPRALGGAKGHRMAMFARPLLAALLLPAFLLSAASAADSKSIALVTFSLFRSWLLSLAAFLVFVLARSPLIQFV